MLQLIAASGTSSGGASTFINHANALLVSRLKTLRILVSLVGLFLLTASSAARSAPPANATAPAYAQVCREVAAEPVVTLQWDEAADSRHREELARWCATIGPSVVLAAPSLSVDDPSDEL